VGSLENAGGTKLFDRSRSADGKVHAHGDSSAEPAVVGFGFGTFRVCVPLMARATEFEPLTRVVLVCASVRVVRAHTHTFERGNDRSDLRRKSTHGKTPRCHLGARPSRQNHIQTDYGREK
jgi:hypothetical protein